MTERRVATTMLGIVVALTVPGVFVAVVGYWMGQGPFAIAFLPPMDDIFADFFKHGFSYPGGDTLTFGNWLGLHELLAGYQRTIGELRGIGFTNAHMPPFSTLLSLLCVRAMGVVDAVALYLVLLGLLAAWWMGVVAGAVGDAGARWRIMLAGFVGYPMLMMVLRGNLFAGLACLAIVHAMLLGLRREAPALGALLLAVAINIRPNAMLFALPLLLLHWRAWRSIMAAGTIGTAAILLGSLAAAQAMDPDYTLEAFRAGLSTYYRIYVQMGTGVAFGSSLYGLLFGLFGFSTLAVRIGMLAGGGLFLLGVALFWLGRIDRVALLFLTCAGYALGSTVFVDYHLLVFLMVPLAMAQQARAGEREEGGWRIMLIASAAMLAPKVYGFYGIASTQVMLNPLILLGAGGMLAWRATHGQKAMARDLPAMPWVMPSWLRARA